ncbi:MAG: NosD domain-containing protein [Candidatus Pacearchaeota archaeon]
MKRAILFIFLATLALFFLSFNDVKADCIGTTKNFSCADRTVNITESCYLNESIKISGHSCFEIHGNMFNDINVDCNGYKIQGDDAQDTYAFGIFGQRVGVKNCIVEDFDKGIYSEGVQSIGIFNNTARSNKNGFYFKNANRNNVAGNIAYNNELGFYAQDSNNLDFYHNIVYNNFVGFYLESSNNNKIFNLTAYNNSQRGIRFERASNNTINQSIVNNNFGDGIFFWSSDYNVISNTVANLNTGQGIYLSGSSHNIISNLTILRNEDNGIYINESQSENNTIRNSYFEDNDRECIFIDAGHNNRIEGNDLNNCTNGLSLSNSENNTILYNVARASSRNGFFVSSNSNNNYLAHNIAYDNDFGLSVNVSYNNTLFNNTAYNNNNGFGIGGGVLSNNNLTRNVAHHNQENGFYMLGALGGVNILENNLAYSNSLSGAPSAGFVILGSRHPVLINNTAQGNLGGIALNEVENATLINNTMSNNNFYNFALWGYTNEHHNHSIDTSNKADGKPIYYIKSIEDTSFDSTNAATFYCIWCDNVTIKNLIISRQAFGVYFWRTNNSRVENVQGTYTYNLIRLAGSSNNVFNNVKMGTNYNYDFESTIGFSNWTFISGLGALNNTFYDFNFNGVIVDFVASNIAMRKTGTIAAPSGYKIINKNVEAKDLDDSVDDPYLFMNISYTDADIEGMQESSLFIARYNGTLEMNPSVFSNPHGVNIAKNYVYANITDFGSGFGVMGKIVEQKAGGGGGSYVPPVCGDGKCDSKKENYLNCPQDCAAPLEPPENVSEDLGDVGEGIEFEGKSGEAFKFKVKGQEHVGQIDGINDNGITLFIWSNPLKVNLVIGKAEQLDLDRNNLAELEILLKKIENGKALLFLKELKEEIAPSISEPEKEEAVKEEKKPSMLLPILIIVVLVVIAVVIVLWRFREKKLRHHGYK